MCVYVYLTIYIYIYVILKKYSRKNTFSNSQMFSTKISFLPCDFHGKPLYDIYTAYYVIIRVIHHLPLYIGSHLGSR